MSNWQEHGGIIGGKSSIGHGKLKTSIILNMDIDINDCIENYKAHVDKTKLVRLRLALTMRLQISPKGKGKKK